MRTQMKIERLRPLIIGHEADNLTGIVEVDCSTWMTVYPELTRYTLAVASPGGGPYFAPTEMEGTILRWIVRREDTACAGEGSYQIIGTGENGEQKSTDFYPLYIYRNMPGLDGAGETPPDAALAWVSKVLNAADRAEDAAERAEGAAAGSVPVAKPDSVGVVKPGKGLEVETDGTLNVVGGGVGGAVESVNGKTGVVELDAEDVGARPDTWLPTTAEIGAQPAGNYLTTESDPNVPEWAKQPKKPTYTPEEIGAQPKGDYLTSDDLPAPYTLPTASSAVKGGVKVGKGLSMDGEVMNAEVTQEDVDKLSAEKADKDKRLELIERIIIGYALTTVQPSDWATNWTSYYIKGGTLREPEYTAVGGDAAPAWESGMYYARGINIMSLDRSKEPDGTPYNFSKMHIYAVVPVGPNNMNKYPLIYTKKGVTAQGGWTYFQTNYTDYMPFLRAEIKQEGTLAIDSGAADKSPAGTFAAGAIRGIIQPTEAQDTITRFNVYNDGNQPMQPDTKFEIWGVRA